jgi:hypothetical protein
VKKLLQIIEDNHLRRGGESVPSFLQRTGSK